MGLRLCVLLWAVPGEEAALAAYESTVLALLPTHGGHLISRDRVVDGEADAPSEVQLIGFTERAGMEGYLADPRRTTLEADRARCVARTVIWPVEPIG